MAKTLTEKQKQAIELLTSGEGLTYKEICEKIHIDLKTLWRWRNEPTFALFQQILKQIDEERWMATVDAARQAAFELVKSKNQKMVEFVLKNEGYNPTINQKIDADINGDIDINVEIEE